MSLFLNDGYKIDASYPLMTQQEDTKTTVDGAPFLQPSLIPYSWMDGNNIYENPQFDDEYFSDGSDFDPDVIYNDEYVEHATLSTMEYNDGGLWHQHRQFHGCMGDDNFMEDTYENEALENT